MWVAEYEKDEVSCYQQHDFLERIVADHSDDIFGTEVQFDGWSERFK